MGCFPASFCVSEKAGSLAAGGGCFRMRSGGGKPLLRADVRGREAGMRWHPADRVCYPLESTTDSAGGGALLERIFKIRIGR